jgi:hypothetical protein
MAEQFDRAWMSPTRNTMSNAYLMMMRRTPAHRDRETCNTHIRALCTKTSSGTTMRDF